MKGPENKTCAILAAAPATCAMGGAGHVGFGKQDPVFRRAGFSYPNRGRTLACAVDLSASRDHDFKDYVTRRAFEERFLPLLLGDGAPAAASAGLAGE